MSNKQNDQYNEAKQESICWTNDFVYGCRSSTFKAKHPTQILLDNYGVVSIKAVQEINEAIDEAIMIERAKVIKELDIIIAVLKK